MTASANIANTKVVPIASRGAPYYDDYNEDKNFYRILIRPGYPIQARELTQMQTMAQVQTERFGRSIYENGSIVQGGQISIDTTGVTLNLATQYANADVNVTQFLNQTIAYGSSNTLVQAYVIGATANSTTEPPALIVKYLTGNQFRNGDTIMVPNTSIIANVAATAANTPAAVASVNDGIFFFNGFFVRAPGQSTVASKYTTQANARVGLAITDDIITEASDTSLLDPAQESSNYQAPGGARYKIELTLTTRSLTSTDDSAFIELLRLDNGVVKKKVSYPIYSDLEDTLARRTFDESGSYTVRAFRLSLSDNASNANTYIATIDPGKAYVHGYEFETIAPTQIVIPRARDTSTVSNYALNMSYGNYLTVSEGRGYLDHSEPMIVDLHCVPHQMIANIASPATTPVGGQYRSTKIGTGRIRMVTYDSASNTGNAQSRVYRLYMFDTQYSNLRSNIGTVVSSNTLILYDPTGQNVFSSQTSAYTGSTIRFTSGPGAGQLAVISNYSVNATGHKTVTTNTNFTTLPTTSTNVSIDFDTKDLESIVTTGGSSNTGANTLWTKYNVTQASRSGGSTFFQESTDPSLIFPFPQDFLKAGSLLSPSVPNYSYKKVFTGVAFTAGTITTPVGGIQVDGINEQFTTSAGVTSGTASGVLQNFIVYVTSAGTSGRSNGDIVQLGTITTSGGGGSTHFVQMVTDGSSPATPDTFTATIVATVQIIAGGETGPKTKVKYTASNTVFNSAASNGSFQQLYQDPITGYSTVGNTTVYLQPGQVVIQNPFRNPGAKQSLYISDAIRISKIWDMGVGAAFPTAAGSLSGYTDVTARYNFDNGQTDTHYGHSSIALKNSTQAPSGNLVVCVDWYDHAAGYTSSGLGYFSVDSYPNAANTGYADIPMMRQSDGLTFSLRDSLDFRPRITNAQNNAIGQMTYQGLRLSIPNYSFQTVQYQYYLNRIDKLVLTKDRQFKLIQGVPAVNPVEPGNITDSMILYKLFTPAYTLYTANVDVIYQENKRYTMRDIGSLEQRITNLEYYTTLSLLEKDASDTTITDSLGLSRAKYGIIVDSFTGHSIGDVTSTDYDCAMDVDHGGMTARNFATATPLYYASNSGITLASQAATLAYTEEVMVTQPSATKVENVQPYMFAIYAGTLKMFPDADIWVDTLTAPAVIINPSGQNDNIVTTPPAQDGQGPRANNLPRKDPHGGRKRWWQIGHFGRRSSHRHRN
jgi:hypothetical protein